MRHNFFSVKERITVELETKYTYLINITFENVLDLENIVLFRLGDALWSLLSQKEPFACKKLVEAHKNKASFYEI